MDFEQVNEQFEGFSDAELATTAVNLVMMLRDRIIEETDKSLYNRNESDYEIQLKERIRHQLTTGFLQLYEVEKGLKSLKA